METRFLALQRSALFRVLPETSLRSILSIYGQAKEIPKGSYLIAPQLKSDYFFVILSGKVQISHIFPDGSFSLINVLTEGEAVCADLICTPSRISPYHAVAATTVQVLRFPAAIIFQPGLLDDATRSALQKHLLTLIANENIKKAYRLAILSQKGLRERIMTYLTMQVQKRGTNTFSIPFSREEMASFLCVNRSALSHELSLLQKEGVICFRKNVFTVL